MATIGRIAAFVNPKMKEKQPTGGLGALRHALMIKKRLFCWFDTGKTWLESDRNGKHWMDPIQLW